MAYLIRNLINDAYKESGVIGIGQTMQAYQTQDGLDSLNLILDEIYATDNGDTTIAKAVTFTGASNYTIGPTPDDPMATPPDIIVNTLVETIDKIVVTVGGVRNMCSPIDPITFNARPLEFIESVLPEYFYYERTNPVGTIRFYEGGPTGSGELIYKPNMLDVTANTDMQHHPRALKPYLVYELARRIARQNGFETSTLDLAANNAWRAYKQHTYQGQAYRPDASAPTGMSNDGWYNIYRGD